MDLKKKALGGIQAMLEDRMSGRLKPKAVSVEIEAVKNPGHAEEGEEEALNHIPMKPGEEDEGMEPVAEEKSEGDMSALSPEEQQQLQMLLEKMGC